MYTPANVPGDPADLPQFLAREHQEISRSMLDPQQLLLLTTLYAAPKRPREGMLVLADGTAWDPGSGAGFYGYRGGAWHLLG